MTEENRLDANLHCKVNAAEKEAFKQKAIATGKPYQVLIREMMHAFNEGRLRIIPTEDQSNSLGELYNVTGK